MTVSVRPSFAISLIIVLLLSLSSCATGLDGRSSPSLQSAIGPYPAFSGRLIVIEPARRWQVLLKWRAETAEQGRVRLTHAATNMVAELQWQHEKIEVRDNEHPDWQIIGQQKLATLGIVVPPQQLASILLGNMPAHFKRKNDDTWESRQAGNVIRLQWQSSRQKLSMTDIKHGRQATLFIQQ
jgi:hypothetical protein